MNESSHGRILLERRLAIAALVSVFRVEDRPSEDWLKARGIYGGGDRCGDGSSLCAAIGECGVKVASGIGGVEFIVHEQALPPGKRTSLCEPPWQTRQDV